MIKRRYFCGPWIDLVKIDRDLHFTLHLVPAKLARAGSLTD